MESANITERERVVRERSRIIDKINESLDDITGDKRARQLSERLKEDCGLDSLSIVNLIISLETGFDIFFDDSDLDPETIITIEDVVSLTVRYVV